MEGPPNVAVAVLALLLSSMLPSRFSEDEEGMITSAPHPSGEQLQSSVGRRRAQTGCWATAQWGGDWLWRSLKPVFFESESVVGAQRRLKGACATAWEEGAKGELGGGGGRPAVSISVSPRGGKEEVCGGCMCVCVWWGGGVFLQHCCLM